LIGIPKLFGKQQAFTLKNLMVVLGGLDAAKGINNSDPAGSHIVGTILSEKG
jgi:hypothetical protein